MSAHIVRVSSHEVLGYYVLVRRSSTAPWEADWDGVMYAKWDDAAVAAVDAAAAPGGTEPFGYEAVVCGFVVQSNVATPETNDA